MEINIEINVKHNSEDDCKMPSSKLQMFILCVVIPFFLFAVGVSSPLWTDNFVVYILCLLPFYTYSFIIFAFTNPKSLTYYVSDKKLFATESCFMGTAIPTLISIIGGIFCLGNYDAFYHGICIILAFNIPVSIIHSSLICFECVHLREVKSYE